MFFLNWTVIVLFGGLAVIGVVLGISHVWQGKEGSSDIYFLRSLFFALLAFGRWSSMRLADSKDHPALDEFRGLTFDDAVSKAKAVALSLPPGLVAHKVMVKDGEWRAFERRGIQFVIVRYPAQNRVEVVKI